MTYHSQTKRKCTIILSQKIKRKSDPCRSSKNLGQPPGPQEINQSINQNY